MVTLLAGIATTLLVISAGSNAGRSYHLKVGPVHIILRNIVPTADILVGAILVLLAVVSLVAAMDQWAISRTRPAKTPGGRPVPDPPARQDHRHLGQLR